MKRSLVNGASGFTGGHMVKRSKADGHLVRAADLECHVVIVTLDRVPVR
jgi:nucleoside-diphosphate-sugar epimerase